MGIEEVSQIELTIVFFDIIFVIISTIIFIKLIFKYFYLRKTVFLTAGLTWLSLSSTYWSSPLAFFYHVLFERPINPYFYIAVNNVQTGFILMFWIYTFCLLIYPERKKAILIPFFTIALILETIMIVLIIIAPYYVATIEGYSMIKPGIYSIIFKFFVLIVVFISLAIFYSKSIKSEKLEIRWKARFLILAMISYVVSLFEILYVGLFIETISIFTLMMIIIFRFSPIVPASTFLMYS